MNRRRTILSAVPALVALFAVGCASRSVEDAADDSSALIEHDPGNDRHFDKHGGYGRRLDSALAAQRARFFTRITAERQYCLDGDCSKSSITLEPVDPNAAEPVLDGFLPKIPAWRWTMTFPQEALSWYQNPELGQPVSGNLGFRDPLVVEGDVIWVYTVVLPGVAEFRPEEVTCDDNREGVLLRMIEGSDHMAVASTPYYPAGCKADAPSSPQKE